MRSSNVLLSVASAIERTEKGLKMTRKDFELIAKAIQTTRNYEPTGSPEATLALVTDVLADMLATTNPAFDRARFRKACEVSA